jgi:ferritin-like metal-binding protein YciE
MEENTRQPKSEKKINFGPKKLKTFFVNHLDKIYAAKAHLVNHLPQIADEIHFSDLRHAILETLGDVEKQMARMEIIYSILDAERSEGNYSGLAGLVDDAFADIKLHSGEPEFRDLSIAFYMQNIESMELASFQVLEMAAVKLKSKQIKQLIKENYAEAKADRTLLLLQNISRLKNNCIPLKLKNNNQQGR